jgi:hypothetical protein
MDLRSFINERTQAVTEVTFSCRALRTVSSFLAARGGERTLFGGLPTLYKEVLMHEWRQT